MFIDFTKVSCYAGKGGAGCVSFRREKYVPKGGPNGGNGGKGGDIVFVVDDNLYTLHDIRYNRIYKAENGEPGGRSEKTGKNGADSIIRVPPGTLIKNGENNAVLADLVANGSRFVACKGGKGGHGNAYYKSATNRAPREAQPGVKGENGVFLLELKVLADVGLVGLPNVGKSTLLSRITSATPRIADYPFTTLQPYLGIVKVEDFRSFVMADIPGIIKGASVGKGLGHQFLKHIERTKLLLLLIDATDDSPDSTLKLLQEELFAFNPALKDKELIVVRTKCDLVTSDKLSKQWLKNCEHTIDISSVTGYAIKDLINLVDTKLNEK